MRAPEPTPPTGFRVVVIVVAIGVLAAAGRTLTTVPLPDPATAAARRAAVWPDMRIDVNRADAARLRALPGVGPTLAERIAGDRDERGPFASMDDLTRVSRVGPVLVGRLRPWAYAGGSAAGGSAAGESAAPAAPTIGRSPR